MGQLRGLFRFQNPDSTKDLNDRFGGLVLKGVFDPGATHTSGAGAVTTPVVVRVPSQLAVNVLPFMAVGSDGMVVVHDAPPYTQLGVTANSTQYIVVRSVYQSAGAADTEFEVLSTAAWTALSTTEKAKRIILAKVTAGASDIATDGGIDLRENDIVDKFDRYFIRGVVQLSSQLPIDSPTSVQRVKTGDVYLVINDRQFYRWDGAAWATVTDGAVNIDLQWHKGVNGPTVALSGTSTATNSSPNVTGLGTAFLDELVPGDKVRFDVEVPLYTVLSIGGQTALTLTTNYGGSTGGGKTVTKTNLNAEDGGTAISRDAGAYPAHLAKSIKYTPPGGTFVVSTNVQDAIAEVDVEKVKKVGDTMTGTLTITPGTNVIGLDITTTGNTNGMSVVGAGGGVGISAQGGSTGLGVYSLGGAGNTLNTSSGVYAVAGVFGSGGDGVTNGSGGAGAIFNGGAKAGTGLVGPGLIAAGNGASITVTSTTAGAGVIAQGGTSQGPGIFAQGSPAGTASPGVYGQAAGTNDGVLGLATGAATISGSNRGGAFRGIGTGVGVYAIGGTTNGTGVSGEGGLTNGKGGVFTGNGSGTGVQAFAAGTGKGIEAFGGALGTATGSAGVYATAGIMATGGEADGGSNGSGGVGGYFVGGIKDGTGFDGIGLISVGFGSTHTVSASTEGVGVVAVGGASGRTGVYAVGGAGTGVGGEFFGTGNATGLTATGAGGGIGVSAQGGSTGIGVYSLGGAGNTTTGGAGALVTVGVFGQGGNGVTNGSGSVGGYFVGGTKAGTGLRGPGLIALGQGASATVDSNNQGAGIIAIGAASSAAIIATAGSGAGFAISGTGVASGSGIGGYAGTGINKAGVYGQGELTSNFSLGVYGFVGGSTGTSAAGVKAEATDGSGNYGLHVVGEHYWESGHQALYRATGPNVITGTDDTIEWDAIASPAFQKGITLDASAPRTFMSVPDGRYMVHYKLIMEKSGASQPILGAYLYDGTTSYAPSVTSYQTTTTDPWTITATASFIITVTGGPKNWEMRYTSTIGGTASVTDATISIVRIPV